MSHDEFVSLVAKMRAMQRDFFRLKPADRPPGLISQAKQIERRVDEEIQRHKDGEGRLFG